MSDLIERDKAIMALRLEYPMMPFFKENRKEWAIKTEGYRKAEEVIMKLPSVDTPTTMTGVIDAIREAEYRGCMKAVEERPKGEWASVLAELHERFDALEKELRRASAEMSAVIRANLDRPKGEWIDMGDFEQCSVCKGTHLKEFQTYYGKATWIKTDFCPSCGADMRGERSGTDKDKFEQ